MIEAPIMSTFSCQCQNYRGNLVVTEKELYFTSSLFRIDLEWSNVKRVRLETQQVKGVPTSVLVVVLQHNEAVRMQATNNPSQRKRGSASRKYFFYGFQDLLGAEELLKHYLEQHRAAEKTKDKETREDSDKVSSAATKRPEKATERDEISSSETDALKEDSLNMSRVAVPRHPESEPARTVAPLSFAGRRATLSTASRPKVPSKALPPVAATATEERRSHITAVFFKLYGQVALLLVLVMLFLLNRYFSSAITTKNDRYAMQTAEKLLRDIDALAGATAGLESYDSQESLWRYNRGRKRLAELSHIYTQQLEETSVELMERYVAIQTKLATLRGHRAARVARAEQSGAPTPPPPPPAASEFSTPIKKSAAGVRVTASGKGGAASSSSSPPTARPTGTKTAATPTNGGRGAAAGSPKAKAAAPRPKKMSLSKLRSDIQRWVRRGRAAWAFLSRLSNVAHGDSPTLQASSAAPQQTRSHDGGWVVYKEELGDSFQLTEWVTAAEDEDRHKCLSLTKDLLETLELTERVFATFSSVFLVDRYRQLFSGEERASYWLQPPQVLRTNTNLRRPAEKAFSGDAMARMAMLRRFVASLVHNEPLVSNQAHRRAAALQVAAALVRYRQEEVALLRTRNLGHTDNTTMLWRILSNMVVAPATAPLKGSLDIPDTATFLRNSVEELRFWHTHESAWQEHVLTFFTPEEQAEIRRTFGAVGEAEMESSVVDPSTQPEAVHWLNLPLFRGLLCFEATPELHEAEGAASDLSTVRDADMLAIEGDDDNDDDDDEDDRRHAASEVQKDENEGEAASHTATSALSVAKTKHAAPSARETPSEPVNSTTSAVSPPSSQAPTPPLSPSPSSLRPMPAAGATLPLVEHTDLWKEVKLRWMADLETFRLAFDPQLKWRVSRAARSYRLDVEDRNVVADAAEVRDHLFSLLAVVNENYVRYMTPHMLQRLGSFLRRLFPPYFHSGSGEDIYVSSLQAWGTQDPAVQLATAQATGLPSGTTHDVSGSLLYLLLQPPPLLQTSMLSTRKTIAAATVFLIFLIVMAVLHLMN